MTTGLKKSLVVAAAALAILALGSVGPADAARTVQLKACVSSSSGIARIVTKRVPCRTGETYMNLFSTLTPPNTVLSGDGAPVDGVTGRDGDFYIDAREQHFYGPRVAGSWGLPLDLVGPRGPAGEPGPAGPTGAVGATGARGPAGADGAGWAGPAGAKGDAGINGTNGTNGKTVLNGAGAPAAGLGSDGDFYIDTTSNRIHGPKAAGAWPAGVSLVGPAGYYGSFYDSTIVTIPKTDPGIGLPMNATDLSNGVSITGGSRITFAHPGTYNVALSLQLVEGGAGSSLFTLWLNHQSTAVPYSATDFTISGTQSQLFTLNFFVTTTGAGDWYELRAVSDDGTAQVKSMTSANDALITGGIPTIPGTIVTVNQIG